jgi:hypothetical protein
MALSYITVFIIQHFICELCYNNHFRTISVAAIMHGPRLYLLIFLKNVVLPEWKPPVYDNTHGITLVTATTRRNSPNVRFFLFFVFSLAL